MSFHPAKEDERAFGKSNPDITINICGCEKSIYSIYYSGKKELKRFFALEKYLKLLMEKESLDPDTLELISGVEKKFYECKEKRGRLRTINLMLILDGDKRHYCWI